MCDKFILENGGMLIFFPDCNKDQSICNKPVDNCPHALPSVLNWYKIQKLCEKAVITYPSTIQFVPGQFETQEMCA